MVRPLNYNFALSYGHMSARRPGAIERQNTERQNTSSRIDQSHQVSHGTLRRSRRECTVHGTVSSPLRGGATPRHRLEPMPRDSLLLEALDRFDSASAGLRGPANLRGSAVSSVRGVSPRGVVPRPWRARSAYHAYRMETLAREGCISCIGRRGCGARGAQDAYIMAYIWWSP